MDLITIVRKGTIAHSLNTKQIQPKLTRRITIVGCPHGPVAECLKAVILTLHLVSHLVRIQHKADEKVAGDVLLDGGFHRVLQFPDYYDRKCFVF